jgi:epoxyqueuosine reductase
LRERARELGFAELRIAEAAVPEARRRAYRAFIAAGRHGTMDWLARAPERRLEPRGLWPDARTAIVVAMNYGQAHDPLAVLERPDRAAISVYAQNRDYHDVMKGRLKQLAGWLAARTGAAVKVFVDTAPLLEKPLAERAGIGWQGKHTNLVSRRHGSWLFLGEILTTAVLPLDPAETDHCGSCRRCLDSCPTDAFPRPYELDARRCISYLTIEHRGPIPREYREAIGNRVYGCDDCLAVCPWNKYASEAQEAKLRARDDLVAPSLAELLALDDGAFRKLFSGSPVKRIGRDRFVRNVLIAAGNSGERALVPRIEALLGDPAAVVRGAAVWALRRLATAGEIARAKARFLAAETEPEVRDEWTG